MQGNQRLLFFIEVAMLAALAFLLDLLSSVVGRFWPQGGSISLAMIPIFIIAFRRGVKGGLLAGLLLGLLQAVLGNPYILHPIQGFLDYYLAFTVVGISGIFFKQLQRSLVERKRTATIMYITLGTLLGCALRLFVHVIAGVYFFASSAPEGTPVWLFSIGYNVSYMIPTFIVAAIVVCFLLLTAPRLVTRK